jgi:hypothetical protein
VAQAAIGSLTKVETIDVSSEPTLREALAAFLALPARGLEEALTSQVVRINSRVVDVPRGLDCVLNDQDFVTIFPAEIARNGIRGEAVVLRRGRIALEICTRECHLLPHVHINKHQAAFDLSGNQLTGRVKPAEYRVARRLIHKHRVELLMAWEQVRSGVTPSRITSR